MRHRLVCAMLVALATPAIAEEERELCAERPGLTTDPCTVERGRLEYDLGLADWTRDRQGGVRTDTLLVADNLLRVGLSDTLEARIGWSAYGRVRERDLATGKVSRRRSGVGDVSLSLKANLRNPDASGFSFALLPYATLPTGGEAIGAGDWGAGLLVPVSYAVGPIMFGAAPEIDAAVDADGNGRHLAYGAVAGVFVDVTDTLNLGAELQVTRDRDPTGRTTETVAGFTVAWEPIKWLQLDVGSVVGLDRNAPDLEIYGGVTRKF